MSEQRILVVEDHEPLLMAVQDILEAEGYIVNTATDGAEALHLVEENRPDLVLTDILMPRMDGYALCEALRARPEWESIPIIFVTARAEIEDELKGKALGATNYITKPFSPDRLLTAVCSSLSY